MKRYLFVLFLVGCASATEPAAVDAKNPVVVMKTSAGTIKIELFEDKAPISVKNFLAYIDDKHYDGTIFHRVIGKPVADEDFMIQGKRSASDEKTGKIEILAADLRTPLFSISLRGLGIFSFAPSAVEAGKDAPRTVEARLYVESATIEGVK